MAVKLHVEDKASVSPPQAAPRRRGRTASPRGKAPRTIGRVPGVAKLDRELRAFEAMSPGALAEYRGRFVAVHRGKVIDSDADDLRLAARIEKRAIREGAIAICWVEDEAEAKATAPDSGESDFILDSPFVDDLEP